jgi:hypothetical protein
MSRHRYKNGPYGLGRETIAIQQGCGAGNLVKDMQRLTLSREKSGWRAGARMHPTSLRVFPH